MTSNTEGGRSRGPGPASTSRCSGRPGESPPPSRKPRLQEAPPLRRQVAQLLHRPGQPRVSGLHLENGTANGPLPWVLVRTKDGGFKLE